MFISIEKVSKSIKKATILTDINLQISIGSCCGITGHNGSGKSMLLKAICGFVPINSGSITIDNKKIINGKNYIENSGVLIEDPPFFNNFNGYDNLKLLAEIKNKISDEDILQTLKITGLLDAKDKKVKQYSLGMKQRLRIAQAIMENPDILILDEPFNGLDKQGVMDIQQIINELKKQHKTILLTSHDERNIEALCDTVYELEKGKLL